MTKIFTYSYPCRHYDACYKNTVTFFDRRLWQDKVEEIFGQAAESTFFRRASADDNHSHRAEIPAVGHLVRVALISLPLVITVWSVLTAVLV